MRSLIPASRASAPPAGSCRWPTAKAEITAHYGDKAVRVSVCCEAVDVNLPINFGNQIVPIFTKLGCNAGGCHGKASGQNGFKLSLFGFEPDIDYEALVKEARGRRIFPSAPGSQPAAAQGDRQWPHGGGKRMEVGSRRIQAHPPLDRGRDAERLAQAIRW